MYFSEKKSRRQSFKGKDLIGANFSHADIQGADFTNTTLTGANFTNAKAGLQKSWQIRLLATLAILSLALGLIIVVYVAFVAYFFLPDVIGDYTYFPGLLLILQLLYLVQAIFYKGLVQELLGTIVVPMVGAIVLLGALVLATSEANLPVTLAGAIFVGGAMTLIVTVAVSTVIAGALEIAESKGLTVVALGGIVGIVAASTRGLIAAQERGVTDDIQGAEIKYLAGAVVVELVIIFLGRYMAKLALAGDEKYAFIRSIAINFAAIGGTSFDHADLTDADFSQARLKSANFRGAILTRTCWRNAEELDRIRPGTTYLQDAKVRKLLITGQGQDQNFDRQNLRGVNL